jgi:hypothetical protein
MEGICEYIEEAVADSRQGVVTKALGSGWILWINDISERKWT